MNRKTIEVQAGNFTSWWENKERSDISTRSFIGAKTKKMQARVKSYEKRVDREIEEKEGLLQDIENPVDLKLKPLLFHKELLVNARDLSLRYEGAGHALLEGMDFQIRRGERVFLSGRNGCGKSSLIHAILQRGPGEIRDRSMRSVWKII